jgi:hypothetical protein
MLSSLILVAFVLGGIAYWLILGGTSGQSNIPAQKVTGRVDYTGQTISMVDKR